MFEFLQTFLETKPGRAVSAVAFAALVIALTVLLAQIVSRVMRRLVERHRHDNGGLATVLGFARYAAVFSIYFAGAMVVVYSIPLLSSAVRTLLTASGVIAVVAGLAAQEALGSVVSGLMILLFKPFKMGDVVRYIDSDISGVIEEITLHHTAIRTWENKRVIIPNSKMNSAVLENADYGDSKVCVFLKIGVTYESDIEKAKTLLAGVIAAHPDYLDVRTAEQKAADAPEVNVVVLELADSAVVLRASLWARDYLTAFRLKCDTQERIKQLYDQTDGVELAYPHLVVMEK